MGIEAIVKAARKKAVLEAAVGQLSKRAKYGKKHSKKYKHKKKSAVATVLTKLATVRMEKRAAPVLQSLIRALRGGGRKALQLGARGLGAVGMRPRLGRLGPMAQRGSEALQRASRNPNAALALGAGGAGLGLGGAAGLLAGGGEEQQPQIPPELLLMLAQARMAQGAQGAQ